MIVSALGRGNSVRADGLFTRASAAVLVAAAQTGVSRLVWLSSFGVGHTFDWSSATRKLIYTTLLRSLYADKAIADDGIRSSGLDWTVVLPTKLTNGPAKGTFLADDRLPMKGAPSISRADVAAFMLRAAHGDEWIHRSPVITG
ncbi:NAD(P)-dependent oxidoreductase [Streptomyces sp. NPDC057623]|uniref:NAD(P)-dependent oxidoreductase n=1 Tax=Streptomyces sp. NPDC057623 TaxID=3346187 RepID=UPI00369209D0